MWVMLNTHGARAKIRPRLGSKVGISWGGEGGADMSTVLVPI